MFFFFFNCVLFLLTRQNTGIGIEEVLRRNPLAYYSITKHEFYGVRGTVAQSASAINYYGDVPPRDGCHIIWGVS